MKTLCREPVKERTQSIVDANSRSARETLLLKLIRIRFGKEESVESLCRRNTRTTTCGRTRQVTVLFSLERTKDAATKFLFGFGIVTKAW